MDGVTILPAVMALEAMTQVASTITGTVDHPAWEDVEFLRPVAPDQDKAATIRVAALTREDELAADVVIRSATTAFAAEHVRGVFKPGLTARAADAPPPRVGGLIEAEDWYGPLFFQGERFARVLGYRQLTATGCVAEISGSTGKPWFAPVLPDALQLADPGPRDAFMHALQACVPDATLLPDRIERLVPAVGTWPERLILVARERSHDGDTYIYDFTVHDEEGQTLEEWQGLRLRALRRHGPPAIAALAGPYLQRRLQEVSGVAVEPEGPDERAEASRRAVSRAAGEEVVIHHRPDGRPEAGNGLSVSISHGPGFVLAVTGQDPLGCDAETAVDRSWPGLLDTNRLTLTDQAMAELGESRATAATRVWAATECLLKAGGYATDPLSLVESPEPGWLTLASGRARIATFVTTLSGLQDPVVFAVLTGTGGGA